jgi:hypothetical protein
MIFLLVCATLTLSLDAQNHIRIQAPFEFKDKNNANRELGKVLEKYSYSPVTVLLEEPPLAITYLIDKIYAHINCYDLSTKDAEKLKKAGANGTYGEITHQGITDLIEILKPTHKDFFIDCGCGGGRFNIEFFVRTPIAKSIGIELAHSRYKKALTAKTRLLELIKSEKHRIDPHLPEHIQNRSRSLEFRNYDILNMTWRELIEPLLAGSTIFIYVASTCMSSDFLHKLAQQLVHILKETQAHGHGSYAGTIKLLTLREFPKDQLFEAYFKKDDIHDIDMSWARSVPVYQYTTRHKGS